MQINVTKIVLYVVLLALTLYCGKKFMDKYSLLMSTNVDSDPYALAEIQQPTGTQSPNLATNESAGAESGAADAVEEIPKDIQEELKTNMVETAVPPPGASRKEVLTKGGMERSSAPDVSGIGLYAVALFAMLLGLGVLVAHDVSSFMAQRAHKMLHNEEGEGIHSAEYDRAEEVWANGDHIEAVRLMREYLNKHPREVHVMVRIAEIYEKDLGNYLAAALEYEELLKKKLPKERWAWSAIHLVNLYYGKLDRPKQGLELLFRIHREYGHTQAAEKARKRLLQLDPEFQNELDRWEAEQSGEEEVYEEEADEESTAQVWTPPGEDPDSQLPKGFRPKR